MTPKKHAVLEDFFTRYGKLAANKLLEDRWKQIKHQSGEESHRVLLEIYESMASFIEEQMWANECPDALLELYQQLFREMETQIAGIGDDKRFEFVITIPVADRPQHLENCLNSLLKLCQRFGYGGRANKYYDKITVLIADDSKQPVNIRLNREIQESLDSQGLQTIYFGQNEQLDQLDQLTHEQRSKLSRVIGNDPRSSFYHKGASITRNITYLKLNDLAGDNKHMLFWFLDSDQEFRINTETGDRTVYAINYFHRLNQIFTTRDALVLTGKVVGDPPVSPAVMAGNFLQDVSRFLSDIAKQDAYRACQFHEYGAHHVDDASYHDMADLFGFRPTVSSFQYQCQLDGKHGHMQCFADFAGKLKRFFDGEHPTRQTHYTHQDFLSSVQPARTIYTGNTIFTAEALQYFIPFATLKLRMAGPVLGRILKSERGQQFISANLPMLHKRTVDRIGQSEFRPGIDREEDNIDLSGEFERQFYGDVMLFTIEDLVEQGYPFAVIPTKLVEQTISTVEDSLLQRYLDKRITILAELDRLKSCFNDRQNWWHRVPGNQPASDNFQYFIHNMEYNFGEDSPAYRMINSDSHRQNRCNEILDAILQLPDDRCHWQEALSIKL